MYPVTECFARKKKKKKRETRTKKGTDDLLGKAAFRFKLRCCRVTAWEALVLRVRQRAYRQRSAKELNYIEPIIIIIRRRRRRRRIIIIIMIIIIIIGVQYYYTDVQEERKEARKTWNELRWLAQGRSGWRNFVDASCSNGSEED